MAVPKVELDAERLITDIVGAVRGLEYGAVMVSVKDGRVVGLERSEKCRLTQPASQQKPYAPHP